ncbi:MAG TPA: cytochrome B6 [Polyangiaceae bacterium]|nr:cytochrome B6 [Polyangiaceae bacterium]
MKRLGKMTSVVLLCALSCSHEKQDPAGDSMAALPRGPVDTGPSDAPPNAPLPPAMCGDMNGGGDEHVDFVTLHATKLAEKAEALARQAALLEARYDLSDAPGPAAMSRGKAVQSGVRTKLPAGVTWQGLAALTPEEIRAGGLFPSGFRALPHPKQPEGGMLFPRSTIDEVLRQTGRDLTRFDLDFDLPEHFLAEFPPAIFLTTRPELGDVSQGQLVTSDNFFELFKCLLNPKQLDGLRLLLTPFAQQQFNVTDDRRSDRPSLGVACFDCHVNGHTNGATHLVGDIRPQENRNRIETTSLRGVNVQQVFGSQRALMSVEDFTEFEQRAAYFDGDPVLATKKGLNPLDRGSQVQNMAEFQKILDFPPAPKLGLDGKLDPQKASARELRGQALFFGKARCAECHTGPHFTDNSLHDLHLERFFEPATINGIVSDAEGPIKTFTLRGLKESPPYFHDGRLLTIDDTIEFFNLILETRLSEAEKRDLRAFLYAL